MMSSLPQRKTTHSQTVSPEADPLPNHHHPSLLLANLPCPALLNTPPSQCAYIYISGQGRRVRTRWHETLGTSRDYSGVYNGISLQRERTSKIDEEHSGDRLNKRIPRTRLWTLREIRVNDCTGMGWDVGIWEEPGCDGPSLFILSLFYFVFCTCLRSRVSFLWFCRESSVDVTVLNCHHESFWHRNKKKLIIGGAVAGVFNILGIAAIIIWRRRRNRLRVAQSQAQAAVENGTFNQPFNITHNQYPPSAGGPWNAPKSAGV
ncbi:hypothetical protein D9758_004956 [Tetrapyrgos nigripes]|uniref:Uncharacterized protein n=1 Tax=Tetrapyrgos nigripes TaxID=182062 RepID=A0A8H5GVU2_9AGAR|nr:hypothetical protein D9758_004956 [Tetrapyrgos nigripes]